MNASSIEIVRDEGECERLEAFLVERIYEFNARATGYFDGRLIGARLRNEPGEIVAAVNGHTWGGCCVVAHLWVHELHRGRGLGRLLLQAVEAEASRRNCEQIVLSTHSFQAPDFYRRLGFEPVGHIEDYPIGHQSIYLRKRLQ